MENVTRHVVLNFRVSVHAWRGSTVRFHRDKLRAYLAHIKLSYEWLSTTTTWAMYTRCNQFSKSRDIQKWNKWKLGEMKAWPVHLFSVVGYLPPESSAWSRSFQELCHSNTRILASEQDIQISVFLTLSFVKLLLFPSLLFSSCFISFLFLVFYFIIIFFYIHNSNCISRYEDKLSADACFRF